MEEQLQPLAIHICTQGDILHASLATPELLCIQDDNQHARVSILAHPCMHPLYVNHVSYVAHSDVHYHAHLYAHGGCQQKQMRHTVLLQLLR
jgi:hypothetical protein